MLRCWFTSSYVDGLRRCAVRGAKEVAALLDAGTRSRTVAATNMNATSSRAHTVFELRVRMSTGPGAPERTSRISLIDLAGSERSDAAGTTGERLREGSNINRSLSALGNCISALAEASKPRAPGAPPPKARRMFTASLPPVLPCSHLDPSCG